MDNGAKLEQISDGFLCSVCLDLLYKPIVLACGHVSCFWCVHWSMSSQHESHCPICRHPYHHFPAICQMLHFLLLKMYPVTYKRRERQVLEDEERSLRFSPNLDGEELNSLGDPGQSSTSSSEDYLSVYTSSTGKGEACGNPKQLVFTPFQDNGRANRKEISSVGLETFSPVAVEEKKLQQRNISGICWQVSVADVLCATCKQLLYRPVVLNCGHVYCEACLTRPADGTLQCQVCQCQHPRGFPKVCLELDHFLEEQFSSEYALRRGTAQLKEVHSQNGSPTIKTTGKGINFSFSTEENFLQWLAEHDSKFHSGVGCDSCGMCPIIGDRYRCKDCTEKMGYDLCGDCYNTRSKLPGRFNQQHTPEHRFEIVKPRISLRLLSGQLAYVSAALNHAIVVTERQETAFPSNEDENDSASPVTPADTIEDQTHNQSPM